MAKRKKKDVQESPEQGTFAHNPFAALGGHPEGSRVSPEGGSTSAAPLDVAPRAKTPTKATETQVKGPPRAVLRILRKGRGGKPVTQVTHLELPPNELKEWSQALRRELGCGATVEGDTIVVQGDQRERLELVLRKRGVRRITMG